MFNRFLNLDLPKNQTLFFGEPEKLLMQEGGVTIEIIRIQMFLEELWSEKIAP